MGITVVPSAVTGQTLSAAQWNTQVRDNINGIWVLTTAGDMLYATGASAAARLAIGTAVEILGSNGSAPVWKSVANAVYPIGSIYISIFPSNPSLIFGGTWVEFAAGRTLVGIDSGQTEFNVAEKTGGEKTVTLTTDQMPNHAHGIPNIDAAANAGGSSGTRYYPSGSTVMGTTNTGGGQPHSNLQPYIVVYMWKRTE